jgi:Flp pilus assembly protein TadG
MPSVQPFSFFKAGRSLGSSRKGAVALLTALSIVPILGLCGLGIDYAMWSHIYVSMQMAASDAALNAVKTAAAGESANDTAYLSEGNLSGAEWFQSEVGGYVSYLTNGGLVVNTTGTATVTSTVSFNGSVHSIFGKLFGVVTYPISGQSTSSMSVAPYLQMVLMLDNSSSMEIAASTAGMNQLMTLSACDPTNAFYDSQTPPYNTTNLNAWTNQSSQAYANYNVGNGFDGSTGAGVTLSPAVADPVPDTGYPAYVANEYPTGTLTSTGGQTSFPGSNYQTSFKTRITCQGVLPKQPDGLYPIPGPPCAFACHWTTTHNTTDPRAGTADLFGLARRSGIQLRFDQVKIATQWALSDLSKANIATYNNISVGIYTFNSTVTQVYPSNCTPQAFGCEAGSDFATAVANVGNPPTYPSVVDTGFAPPLGGRTGCSGTGCVSDNDNTAFPEAMNTMASTYVTPTGDGTASTKPRKVLILITDGFQDDPNITPLTPNERRAFDPSYCTQFKTPVAEGGLGYLVYVVYTPYYPVPEESYVSYNWAALAQGTGSTSISTALQACSSQSQDPTGTYYIEATDQNGLNNAISTFVGEALNSPARFTH